jgi:uncharacterized GH25 family protein
MHPGKPNNLLSSTPMTTLTPALACLLTLCALTPLQAHEFWLKPLPSPVPLGSTVKLVLEVGENFEGELVGLFAPKAASLQRLTTGGRQDLQALLPSREPLGELPLRLGTPGTHLLTFDSQPSTIELSADKFHAYLHDEGLDFVRAQREAAGTDKTPGRERYRRHVKTLVQVSGTPGTVPASSTPDLTYAQRVGQRLELLPLNDPLALKAGGSLGVQVLFEQQPLAGALVKAWHKRAAQTFIIRAITNAQGQVKFDLPYGGPWMVSVVHMVPAVGTSDADWDSLWGNLSFTLAPADASR